MPFVPKDWKDAPDHSTPLSAAAMEDLETRVTAYADTVSGGSDAPTDVLLLGTDIAMSGNWTVASLFDWGDYPARVYKQGGRVHLQGAVIKGSGVGQAVATLPADYAPALFGETADAGAAWRWPVGTASLNLLAVALIKVEEDGIHLAITGGSAALSQGDEVYLDGISWPLNFTGPD